MNTLGACMVMLTSGRNEMPKRAIRCFQSQIYQPRCLLIYDTGSPHMQIPAYPNVKHIKATRNPNDKIGDLRNLANAECPPCDVILHLDDDDWSHPLRMGEQIEMLLGEQPLDAVGYNDLVMYHTPPGSLHGAWLYRGAPGYAVGTSLCYWRRTWRSKPFKSLNSGEDNAFMSGLRSSAVSSNLQDPRIVATYHGANTASYVVLKNAKWNRLQEMDAHCERVLSI
jgi:hypothetical protein